MSKKRTKNITLQCTWLVNHLSSKAELTHRNPKKQLSQKCITRTWKCMQILHQIKRYWPLWKIQDQSAQFAGLIKFLITVCVYMYTWQMDHWVQRCLIQLGSGPSRLVRYNQQIFIVKRIFNFRAFVFKYQQICIVSGFHQLCIVFELMKFNIVFWFHHWYF